MTSNCRPLRAITSGLLSRTSLEEFIKAFVVSQPTIRDEMDETSKECKNCDKISEQSIKVLKEKQTKEANSSQSTPKIKIPRTRNERTSSDENLVSTSDDGPDSPQPSNSSPNGSPDGKRQKPESPQSPPPNSPGVLCFGGGAFGHGITPSPPKFVSLEEIMKAANGVENMALAHEIAVDNNFKIEKPEPSSNRSALTWNLVAVNN